MQNALIKDQPETRQIPSENLTAYSPAASFGKLPQITQRMAEHRYERVYPPVVLGATPQPGDLVLANNDYLSLAADPRIIDVQIQALSNSNQETYMSGVFSHFQNQRQTFEQEIADFVGAEAALLCQSGFAANDGLLQSIAGPDTPVYVDFYAHASLTQGAISAGAPLHRFRHNSADHLDRMMEKHGPGIVAVDSVYSSIGDQCPLKEILDVVERHGALILVDESHSIGLYGDRGQGLVAAAGLSDRVHYRTFSLSKAFVGRGGIIAGPSDVLDFVRFESRHAIFSSTVLDNEVARFRKVLEIVSTENWRRIRLHENAAFLQRRLDELGYNVSNSESPIIPLEAGKEIDTATLRDALEAKGIFGAVFCAPATPLSRSLVRLCVHAALTRQDLERIVRVCRGIREDVGMQQWPSTQRKRRTPQVTVKPQANVIPFRNRFVGIPTKSAASRLSKGLAARF